MTLPFEDIVHKNEEDNNFACDYNTEYDDNENVVFDSDTFAYITSYHIISYHII